MWPLLRPPTKTSAPAARLAPHRRFLPGGSRRGEVAEPPHPSKQGRGLYAGEPDACRRDARQFVGILAHLGLLLAVSIVYRVEGRAFQLLLGLSAATLPIHYALPYRWKKPFFIGASIVGLGWVFGPAEAALVIALGAALLGVCHLPIGWWSRVAILGALGIGLALVRAGIAHLPVSIPDVVWPVAGSLFMFRLIIYMYERKHADPAKPERLVDALGYFFLLPNACFLHFPVVDYRTLLRGYFAADIHAIQRRGLQMIFRGVVQLLLYRMVYHLLLITPEEVEGPASLAGFLACNYLLYLRVSGQFHVACGMLHLFGFQLPDTHHHYLLATSFTDYWRRINIYWKDFMVRVVFNPVVFRLKKRPQAVSLAVATVAVFLTTWALHAYQSFWLRGRWGFSVPDALFWGILGGLVLVNVRMDAKRPRRVAKGRSARETPRELAIRGLKVAGTLTTIMLLWSLWSSPSLGAWLGMLRRGLGG